MRRNRPSNAWAARWPVPSARRPRVSSSAAIRAARPRRRRPWASRYSTKPPSGHSSKAPDSYNGLMNPRLTLVTVGLASTVGLLVGMVLAGNLTPAPAVSAEPRPAVAPRLTAAPRPKEPVGLPPSFAEIAARVNPAVVTVNSSAAGDARSDRRGQGLEP